MARTHNARIFLTGVILVPVGWVLFGPIGGRVADPIYRNDEDLNTLLALLGGLLILSGIVLIMASIHRAIRKLDRIDVQALAQANAPTDATDHAE